MIIVCDTPNAFSYEHAQGNIRKKAWSEAVTINVLVIF
jgi:hypothetical protein